MIGLAIIIIEIFMAIWLVAAVVNVVAWLLSPDKFGHQGNVWHDD